MNMSSETLKILDELTAILDLSDEFSYKELYEQAKTYIFNKKMEMQMIVVKATWYVATEEQADEMVRSLVEKYKVGINYSTEVYEESDDE